MIRSVLSRFGLTRIAESARQARRAYEQGFDDGGEDEPVSGTLALQGYNVSAPRDVKRVIDDVWNVYQSNPVAARAISLKVDYILGRGVQLQAEEDLTDVFDDFKHVNKFDRRLKDFVRQLLIFGAQCLPVFVRETDGRVRLGYIDPVQIETVIAHPDNAMEMWAVVVKQQPGPTFAGISQRTRVYRIIREDEPALINGTLMAAPNEGRLVTWQQAQLEPWELAMLAEYNLVEYSGSCFYEKINSLSNQPHGYSDLLRSLDWLEQHDQVLFNLADREQMAGYFFADVTLMGMNDDQVQARAGELRRTPPKRGSVNVHNDKEAWNLHHPDLKQQPSVATAEALFDHVWGGLGYPRHWYVQGDTTNRATAEDQSLPTERALQSVQDDVQAWLTTMFTFVRDQAEIAGQSFAEPDFEVVMPEVQTRTVTELAQSLSQMALALATAMSEELMTREQAIEVWAKVVAETGVEIDIEDVLAMETEPEPEIPDAFSQMIFNDADPDEN